MGAVDYVIALEQEMELVPLKRGWWVAFGAPGLPAARWGAAPPRPRSKAATAPVPDPPPRPTRQ
jgi:hypothetical protein